MSSPTFQNLNPYVYFTCNRDPTATEPDVATIGIPATWLFYWWNTTSLDLFVFHGGASGSMVWKKCVTPQNIATYQIQADWNESSSGAAAFIKNKPSLAASRTQSAATRSLNSGFQISASKDFLVHYSVDIACTLSLTGGQTGTVFLEIASDSGFTTNLQELCRSVNGNTGTLTIGLNITQNSTGILSGYVPSGYYCRMRTANTVGSPTFNFRSGQEVLL